MVHIGSVLLMFSATASVYTGACAMSTAEQQQESPRCRVLNGEKLSSESGGREALCEAIEKALADQVPGVPFSAEVRVTSRSRLSAKVTVNGLSLPEQNLASSDRELTRDSFERFARSIASQAALALR